MASKPDNKDSKNKGGRPEHEFDKVIAGKLEALITYGVPQENLAAYIGVSLKTLKKHYKEIFQNCQANQKEAVRAALFYQATKLNIPASTIFWLKTRDELFQEKGSEPDNTGEFLEAIARTINANKASE